GVHANTESGGNGHLGQSLWLREIHGREEGPPPPVDLVAERRNGEFVRAEIARGAVTAVHDVSDGGIAVAIAEMALAGRIGATWVLDDPESYAAAAFGEDQGRYIVTTTDPRFADRARKGGIPCQSLGRTGGNAITCGMNGAGTRARAVSLADLRAAHEGFFPKLMGADAALA
ncbi:MAG: phosphoribosylformylglycinamidine synthase subunit PurL, partial [Sphingomonas bacterium]|nr:phosphoribosylformylglycinamidine synthase subunit PurL [Sphingomonas bacterium]